MSVSTVGADIFTILCGDIESCSCSLAVGVTDVVSKSSSRKLV